MTTMNTNQPTAYGAMPPGLSAYQQGYRSAVLGEAHLYTLEGRDTTPPADIVEQGPDQARAWRTGVRHGLEARGNAYEAGRAYMDFEWCHKGRVVQQVAAYEEATSRYSHCQGRQAAFQRGADVERKAIGTRLRRAERNRRRYHEERNAGWRAASYGDCHDDANRWSPTSALYRAFRAGYRAYLDAVA